MATVNPLELRFVRSATDVVDLPPTAGELAIVGRSNVGKSSLINALANRQQLARVSKTPGRTQLLNLFELPDGTTVVDLPGYGFANAPAAVRARWPEMIEGYLLRREGLRGVVVLVDAEVGPTELDRTTLAWLRSHGLPVHVVATKHDKVRPSRRAARRAELAAGCELDPAEVLWVSAAKRVNLDRLRALVLGWLAPDGGRPVAPPGPSPLPAPEAEASVEVDVDAVPAVEPDDDRDWWEPPVGDRSDDEDEW